MAGIDLKVISETKKLSDGSLKTLNKSGTGTNIPYGEIITTEYMCPCGKGRVVLTEEKIPGYYDFYASIECADCEGIYEVLWGKGVSPGRSPMVRKKL